MNINKNIADIIYSGAKLCKIKQATIDLNFWKVLDKKTLVWDTALWVRCLEIIRDNEIHNQLIKIGKENFKNG
ncbi:hypothetical protein ACFL1H_06680 [Nanoarchaeota archaeon]